MSDAALFIEWVYANPGLPPEEYAVKCQEFIDEATAAEREACAKIADEQAAKQDTDTPGGWCSANTAKAVAAAIRARKEGA